MYPVICFIYGSNLAQEKVVVWSMIPASMKAGKYHRYCDKPGNKNDIKKPDVNIILCILSNHKALFFLWLMVGAYNL